MVHIRKCQPAEDVWRTRGVLQGADNDLGRERFRCGAFVDDQKPTGLRQ